MAGDDPVLARWRDRYDPMAVALWRAVRVAGTTFGTIAALLTDTGDTYLAADHPASAGASGRPLACRVPGRLMWWPPRPRRRAPVRWVWPGRTGWRSTGRVVIRSCYGWLRGRSGA